MIKKKTEANWIALRSEEIKTLEGLFSSAKVIEFYLLPNFSLGF